MMQPVAKSANVVDDTDLSSPQFDDERTLLSAKPVIPLAEVASEKYSKSTWNRHLSAVAVGVLAFSISLVSFIYLRSVSERNRNALPPAAARSQTVANPDEKTQGGTVDSKSQGSTPQRGANKPVSTRVIVQAKDRDLEPVSDDVQNETYSVAPDTDSWQSRREMRRNRRRYEQQGLRDEIRFRADSRDGVFRINDIFEGKRNQ